MSVNRSSHGVALSTNSLVDEATELLLELSSATLSLTATPRHRPHTTNDRCREAVCILPLILFLIRESDRSRQRTSVSPLPSNPNIQSIEAILFGDKEEYLSTFLLTAPIEVLDELAAAVVIIYVRQGRDRELLKWAVESELANCRAFGLVPT